MIPDDDDGVAMQDRRRALAELIAHPLLAEDFLPAQRAVHVVGVQPERLEVREERLAVGERRARRPGTVLRVAGLVGFHFVRDALPHRPPGRPVECDDLELVTAAWLEAAARRVLRVAAHVEGNRRRDEHAVAPHDRRGVPAARHFDLPADVLRVTPFDRRVGGRRGAVRMGAAPLRPEAVGWGIVRRRRSAV